MTSVQLTPLPKSVKTEVNIPGSKSYTNRALLIASMVDAKVRILNPLFSEDTKAMINCLKKLGIKIVGKKKSIEVIGSIKDIKNKKFKLNANQSGTTIRFLLALSAVTQGVKILEGREGLNKRPIGDLVEGLKQLGANIKYLNKKGYPPILVSSSKLTPGKIKITGYISSQYISSLLMIAPIIGEVVIEVTSDQTSKPYIDMTIDIMEKFGVKVFNQRYKRYKISGNQKYKLEEYSVEGDISSASYFFAIAALTKSTLTVKNINPDSVQADMKFLEILKGMGNKIIKGGSQITIIGNGIKPIHTDMQDCPDQIQTAAILAAFADGISKISGISTLKIKETDRILALRQELKKMGIRTNVINNTLTIEGGNPKAACVKTYGDHRMAMSFAVAGAKLTGMEIIEPKVVNKTFPGFWKQLSSIGVKTKNVDKNIVLIGMRGSGKSVVARLLSQKLNKNYLEMDDLIVKKTGMKIPEMIEKKGWNFFRREESKVAITISSLSGKIISTGGGVVTKPENIDVLKKNGIFVFLKASLSNLLKRIGDSSNRPALTDKKTKKEEVEAVLKERTKLYEQTADLIINTNDLNSNEVVNIIINKLKEVV